MAIVEFQKSGTLRKWVPRTLHDLGKDEAFLEAIAVREPAAVGLESLLADLGAVKTYTQITLQTAGGRGVRPDILLVSASGHLVVVEVKQYENRELRSRLPVAQILDYAAVLSRNVRTHLLPTLSIGSGAMPETWGEYFATSFPDLQDAASVAKKFVRRVESGRVHLVLLCDRIPPGVFDWLERVSAQTALPFEFQVIEAVPHAPEGADSPIVFVPATRAETETIQRTVVEIRKSADVEGVSVNLVPLKTGKALAKTDKALAQRKKDNVRALVRDAIAHLRRLQPPIFAPAGPIPLRNDLWVHASRCIVVDFTHPTGGDVALDLWFNGLLDASDRVVARFILRGKGKPGRMRFATQASDAIRAALEGDFGDVQVDIRHGTPTWLIKQPAEVVADGWSEELIATVAHRILRAVATIVEFTEPKE